MKYLSSKLVSSLVSEDQQQCEPGFSEQRYAFTVNRKVLERGRIIGKVSFTSCSTNNRALYSPDDTRFRVFPDGKVTLKRQITLHDGSVSFVLNAWDAKGMRHSVPIFVWNEREQQKAHGKGKQPLLVFPEKPSGLKRRKRHWVIPPIRVPENLKGPFPKRFAQIRSTMEANMNILYSITGQGVDSPPEGVFSVEKETGRMMVNKPLDREEYASYTESMSGGSLLSTHVLNTAQGIPAKGLTITLSKMDASETKWVQVSRSVTNEDGRCPGLLRGEPLTAGTFQLRFDTKDYWKQMQQDSFYPYVEVVFTITDPQQKHHVPLLLSPFSYTTYRGS